MRKHAPPRRNNLAIKALGRNGLKKNFAFTLAEVLITLGIIGVISALTLPTVIQSYKKQETSARLKKFYSSMAQAITSAEAEYGTKAYEWDKLSWTSYDPMNSYSQTAAYYDRYIAPYIKTLNVVNGVYDPKNNINTKMKIYFQDGSTTEINVGQCISLHFDTNGDKLPNAYGRDKFVFFIATEDSHKNNREQELYKNQSFAAAYLPLFNTKTKALNACKNNAIYCSSLLQYNNFEFPKDYPYKL